MTDYLALAERLEHQASYANGSMVLEAAQALREAHADGKAAFDLSVECRARAVRAEAEVERLRALLREARKELEAPSTPYSRRIVIARIDAELGEKP